MHVYEKFAKAGGLLRYGIPDFKMEKHHIDRRVAQMQAEGVVFHYSAHVGVNVDAKKLVERVRRRGADRRRRKRPRPAGARPRAQRHSFRHGFSAAAEPARVAAKRPMTARRSWPTASTSSSSAAAIPAPTASAPRSARARCRCTNFEIMPEPPLHENKALTWPNWPLKLRTSSSHEEGAERDFAVNTTAFSGENGAVRKLHCVRVDDKFKPIPGTEFEIEAELVLLAMGFVHPVHEGMLKNLDARTRSPRQCRRLDRRLQNLDRQGICRGRHAPRPVAGGVGDPRRPPGGACGRQISDGLDAAAAVIIRRCAVDTGMARAPTTSR